MPNVVKEIVFPLDRNHSISQGNLQPKRLADVLYLSIGFKELKRVAKVSREHNVSVAVNNHIHIYSNTLITLIKPKMMYHGSDWAEVYMPETYITVNFDWLLKQVEAIEKGSKHTEHCLLDGDRLVVLSTEVVLKGRSDTAPTALIAGLAETVQDLLGSGRIPDVWKYFTDFIVTVEESGGNVKLSDHTKHLIADMKLRDTQDTAVYRVLQGISSIVDVLQKKQVQKLT